MSKGYSADRHVTTLFDDATYCLSGLDAGKWITQHYKFDLKHAFYTTIENGKTYFVNGKEWKKILNGLKELEDKEVNVIS